MNLVGSAALTYFCGTKSPEAVSKVVGESLGLSLAGDWTSEEMNLGRGHLKVSRRIFAPNSDFSKVVLGIHAAVRRGTEVVPGGREEALAVISGCDVMLGAVFEPPLLDDDDRLRVAAEWASLLDGVMFDGRWILASTLEPLVEVSP